MSWMHVLAGLVAAALFVYLVVAVLKPEWFE
jgi:K+-transporting ATPase KdpF subunit